MDRRLNAFLAVARHGTTIAAATHLRIAQSAITKRVAALEQELGTALFLRDRRGMTLTEAGELFLRRAVRIEREYRDGLDEVAAIASAGLAELKIGAGPVFHLNWASGLCDALLAQFPDLKLDLQTLHYVNAGDRLMSGELDVYLGIIPPENLDDSVFVTYGLSVEHGIVMRAADPNSTGTTIDPARLSDYRWVSFVVDPVTERSIEQYTLPNGTNRSPIDIRTTSFATGVQLVKTGKFVMSAPLQLADIVANDGLVIRPVQTGMPRRDAGIHARKSAMGYGAIKAVFSYFESILSPQLS